MTNICMFLSHSRNFLSKFLGMAIVTRILMINNSTAAFAQDSAQPTAGAQSDLNTFLGVLTQVDLLITLAVTSIGGWVLAAVVANLMARVRSEKPWDTARLGCWLGVLFWLASYLIIAGVRAKVFPWPVWVVPLVFVIGLAAILLFTRRKAA